MPFMEGAGGRRQPRFPSNAESSRIPGGAERKPRCSPKKEWMVSNVITDISEVICN